MGGRVAFPIAVALWLGLAGGAPLATAVALGALLAALPLAALAWRAPPRTGVALLVVSAFALGLARGAGRERALDAREARLPRGEVTVRIALVLDEPARREADAPACVGRLIACDRPWPRGVRARLRLPAGCDADWADTVVALARTEPLPGMRNPGGFDARAAARSADVFVRGRAFTAVLRRASGPRVIAVRLAMRLRRAMERSLARESSAGARELTAPLLFGDRSAMTPETDARLRASGLVHLLALSGLHVVWLAAVVRGAAAAAGRGLRTRALAGAACAALYAMLAGPLPSLMRAVAGETLTALGRLTQRALDPLQTLGVAVVALLAWHPGWAGDLGFQLSCAATLGLVTLAGPFAAPFSRVRWAREPLGAVATTLAAQVTALPVLIARFHAVPWTGVAANLLAVPVSELLLAAAWLGGMLEALSPGSGRLWLHAGEPLAAALRAITAVAASPPLALWPCGASNAPAWLAAAGALALAIALPAPRTLASRAAARGVVRVRVALAGTGLLAAAVFVMIATPPLAPPPGRWWLVAIDVGQGDALALAFGDAWWLIDAGPRSPTWDAGEGAVLPFLRWAGVRSLERLIVTHDDSDHTGGAPAVRRGLIVRATFASSPRPGVPGPAARFRADTLARGEVLRESPPVRVCWPPHAGERDEAIARRGDNAAALVIEAGEGGARALLTADADSLVEAVLDVAPGLAVLKAGHHGSGSSSGAAFVRRVVPERVLLSVGPHNPYGHPNPGALARLALTGATFDRTDRDGAVWYEFGPEGVRVLDWRTARAPGTPTPPALHVPPPPAR